LILSRRGRCRGHRLGGWLLWLGRLSRSGRLLGSCRLLSRGRLRCRLLRNRLLRNGLLRGRLLWNRLLRCRLLWCRLARGRLLLRGLSARRLLRLARSRLSGYLLPGYLLRRYLLRVLLLGQWLLRCRRRHAWRRRVLRCLRAGRGLNRNLSRGGALLALRESRLGRHQRPAEFFPGSMDRTFYCCG